jgi:hypothetical protein
MLQIGGYPYTKSGVFPNQFHSPSRGLERPGNRRGRHTISKLHGYSQDGITFIIASAFGLSKYHHPNDLRFSLKVLKSQLLSIFAWGGKYRDAHDLW